MDTDALRDIFPYGRLDFVVVEGGLDVPRPDGLPTVIANVALSVALELDT